MNGLMCKYSGICVPIDPKLCISIESCYFYFYMLSLNNKKHVPVKIIYGNICIHKWGHYLVTSRVVNAH